MNNTDRDYVFNVHWADKLRNSYKVGLLAQIDKIFYFIMSGPKNAEAAYRKGFVGVPGFQADEIYKSQELFDFFKSRVLEDKSQNPCEELAQSKGISMTDSFSVEEVSEGIAKKYKEAILRAYEVKARSEELKNEKENKQGTFPDNR